MTVLFNRDARPRPVFSHQRGFTLLELLVVIAIVLLLSVLVVPVMNSMSGSGNLGGRVYEVSGILERARAYAMANNSYVWVGFYEEDAGTTTPTSTQPPYPGKGQVVIATVASTDGTQIFADNAVPATLPADRITLIDRIVKIQGVHLADLAAPSGGDSKTLNGRPAGPSTDDESRISSDSANKTDFPFAARNYTFYKTIRFNPRGEASINGNNLKRTGEIGLRPTHGNSVDLNTPNVAAIQFTGIGGNVQVYRP